MKLTVLMAVFNNAQTLEKSVKSILNQSFKDFQFVIVNDASTDESSQILSRYSNQDSRIKLIKNQHRLGLTKSLNIGLKIIKTKYIARMDADDISLLKRLEKQFNFLESHPKIFLVGTAVHLIDSKDKKLKLKTYPIDHKHLKKTVLHFCPFIHPTWMIRRSAMLELNGYNQDFNYAQDYELVLRLLTKFKAANLPEPLLKYRVNYDQAISLKNLKAQECLALKARFLALTRYGYSITESWKLIKPLLSYLIPSKIKTKIYQKYYWDR